MEKRNIHAAILFFAAWLSVFIAGSQKVMAQDTLRISLEEFIQTGIEQSGQMQYEQQKIELAQNEINRARATRFLPEFELNTQHGAVPGVSSNNPDLERGEYYLDPNLENDWENWAIFTRAEIRAVQPLFSWGALTNLVQAAQAGARAAGHEFQTARADLELRLYELYYSYVLSREILTLVEEAQNTIEDIEGELEERIDDPGSDIDDTELFKFELFKSEFAMRAAEVRENISYIRSIWDYVLQAGESTVYLPSDRFLDPVANEIEPLDYYLSLALENRAELKRIDAGIEAAQEGIKATRARNLPMLYLGLTGSYANTPNRPRQDNPFIINSTNYASAGIGFGIRQNLDLFSAKTEIEHRQIQHRQVKFLRSAAVDGIMLEVNDKYKNSTVSEVSVSRTDEMLLTSRRWVRQEQLDYDFGIGDTQDLIDAMQRELELRFQLKQRIFEFNKNMAELYKAAGIPLTSLNIAN